MNTSIIPDYSRKWLVLIAVGMGISLVTIDGSIVNISLPTLVISLRSDFSKIQWVSLSYLITIISLLPAMGRLADILGKKSIYNIGFIVFTLGSVLCGLSRTVDQLIFFRIIQAIGAAMVMALGMAIVTEAFPTGERGRAMGISGTIVSVGIVIGPTLGGFFIQNLNWHWIFLVNFPIGMIGTILVILFVPRTGSRKNQRFDSLGAISLSCALLLFMFCMTFGQRQGFNSSIVYFLGSGSILLIVTFLIIEKKVEQPIIKLSLFLQRNFSGSILSNLIIFICIAGLTFLTPFYAEDILGFNPQRTGLLMAIIPIALGVISPVSGYLSDRYGSDRISLIGLVIACIGFFSLISLNPISGVQGFALRVIPVGLGVGLFQPANYSALMGFGSSDQLGVISGLVALMRNMGQACGISLFGAVWANRVFFHTGALLAGGPTLATTVAQMEGLKDVFIYVALMCLIALIFCIWGSNKFRVTLQDEN